MRTRTVAIIYAVCFAALLGQYLYRKHEFDEWKAKDRVVMRSHAGYSTVDDPFDPSKSYNLGDFAFFQIVNESSKRVKMTNFWLDGCSLDGRDLSVIGRIVQPKALEPADDHVISIPLGKIPCKDWLDRGRVRLTDGSVIKSTKNEGVPAHGTLSMP